MNCAWQGNKAAAKLAKSLFQSFLKMIKFGLVNPATQIFRYYFNLCGQTLHIMKVRVIISQISYKIRGLRTE